jgi:Domain of unknown function (DUF4160)
MIRMYFDDHAPPHIHVAYNEHKAIFSIQDMTIIRGKLPRRASELVLDWMELHKAELMENWQLCRQQQPPKKIHPLE